MRVKLEAALAGSVGWNGAATETFNGRGFAVNGSRTIEVESGKIECVEASLASLPQTLWSNCLGVQSGVVAVFEGDTSSLRDFYSMVETANRSASKRTRSAGSGR